VTRLLLAVGWGLLGALAGVGINHFNRWQVSVENRFARRHDEPLLEHELRPWETWLAPALTAVLFAVFAWQVGFGRVLVIDSLYAAVLAQVFTFDLKHRYILDVVILPAAGLALLLAFLTPWSAGSWPAPDWRTALVAALIAGAVFAVLFFIGTWLLGQEAFGFGDVKLAVFIGMATGLSNLRMVHALLAGVYLGGAVAIILLLTRRARLKQAVPYAPFLVAGTVLTLLLQQP
jgi:prepilin signal peptidase PulO-like enzyme (type II secretory pathway)